MWADEEPAPGIGPMKMNYRGLTEAEQADNLTTSRVLADGSGGSAPAVGTDHVQTGALAKRWFGGGDNPDLPGGVMVMKPNVSNNAVHPKDHIDWDVKDDSFIPKGMLKDKPWTSKTELADVKRIIEANVKPTALKKKR